MGSLRTSFKSHTSSYKQSSSRDPSDLEQQPILLPDDDGGSASFRGEVVVKIDGNSRDASNNNSKTPTSTIWRDSSYDFSGCAAGSQHDNSSSSPESAFSFKGPPNAEITRADDPPSQLIRKFLHKQRDSGSEIFLDMDLEMEDFTKPPSSDSPSKESRVSFKQPTFKKPSSTSSSSDEGGSAATRSPPSARCDGAEVLRCTSNSNFHHTSSLLRPKTTRSRLMDPAPPPPSGSGRSGDDKKSGRIPRSGMLKSGMLGSVDEDFDDEDGDLPEDFNRAKLSFLSILQWASLVLILGAFACTLSISSLRYKTVLKLALWKWEVLALVLICGRLVSGWAIRIAIFFIERNFLLRKRLLYFVYGIRKAVQNCLWFGLVLVAWHYLFDKRVERQTNTKTLPYITKILFCLIVATVFRLVKTLLVKVLASSFHVSTYFDRIQEALFNQYVVETLTGPPLIEIQNTRDEEDRVLAEVQKFQNAGATIPNDLRAAALPSKTSRPIGSSGSGSGHGPSIMRSSQIGKSIKLSGGFLKKDTGKPQDNGITIDQLYKLNQKNVSAWNMKRLMRIVRHGALSTLDEQIPQANGEDESAMTIKSEYEAKIAAKKIFKNVAQPGAKYIYLEDLMRFMREEEALKTISLFEDTQENKRISRKSLKTWVVNAFRERRALALTLNDTKTAVNKLHQMANVVVAIIVLAIWLLILGIATTQFFVFLSSQVLLAVFIFGNTLKMIFEAIIFLFVMHPFDVGDRCEVEGNQMIVEEMNILTTIFLKADNTKVTYPNTVLATQPICNFYRSPDQGDAIDFCVHVSTAVEKLALMKEKIIGFMENKKDYWYPGPLVVLRDIDDMNRLKISIWLRHRINFQDMGLKWTRRELILQELIRISRELDIEYRMLPLDVNCRNMPTLSSTRLPSNWTSCN